MQYSHPGSFREQANFLRRQFLQDGDLPFTNVLTEDSIAQSVATLGGWLDRLFPPLVTLWVFLGQVLSADHSCRAAVARLIAHRLVQHRRNGLSLHSEIAYPAWSLDCEEIDHARGGREDHHQ